MFILILFLTFWVTFFASGIIAYLVNVAINVIVAVTKGEKISSDTFKAGKHTGIHVITLFALIACLFIWSTVSVRHSAGHCFVDHGLLNMIRLSILHLVGVGGVQCQ